MSYSISFSVSVQRILSKWLHVGLQTSPHFQMCNMDIVLCPGIIDCCQTFLFCRWKCDGTGKHWVFVLACGVYLS